MLVTVVTPTYNEAENIRSWYERVRAALPHARVVVVDDGSPDGTGEIVAALAKEDPGLELIRRNGKGGLASAYVEGFRSALAAGADRVVQMDADLSHDPADLPRLLSSSADLVLGSRYVPGGGVVNWPRHRLLLSRGGALWARGWLGLGVRDPTGGFKVWGEDALRRVLVEPVRSEGYVFQVEMTLRARRLGRSIVEVPIVFTERVEGRSKMSAAIALEATWRVPLLRRGGS